jgi:hypothetical protein
MASTSKTSKLNTKSVNAILKSRKERKVNAASLKATDLVNLNSLACLQAAIAVPVSLMDMKKASKILFDIFSIEELPDEIVNSIIFWMRHAQVNVTPEVTALMDGGLYTHTDEGSSPMMCNTAAYLLATLFCKNYPQYKADKSLIDVDEEAAKFLGAEAYNVLDLHYSGLSPKPLFTSDGKVQCHCGDTPKYIPARAWGNGVSPARFECQEKKCKFQVTTNSLAHLKSLLDRYELDSLPMLYCPQHPGASIGISTTFEEDNKMSMRVRCCAKPDSASGTRFCEASANILAPTYVGSFSSWTLKILAAVKNN